MSKLHLRSMFNFVVDSSKRSMFAEQSMLDVYRAVDICWEVDGCQAVDFAEHSTNKCFRLEVDFYASLTNNYYCKHLLCTLRS